MGFTCGIVGLPNVGKSTIFNALTSSKVQAQNFPFCTIEPNTGSVAVPDPRLLKIHNLTKSQEIIPTQTTFVDIAGLIKGASSGQGLGNQFLGHIRSVDAVVHVVRCFDDDDVVHVEGKIDPVGDLETIFTELAIADFDSLTKQVQKVDKLAKSGDKEAKDALPLVKELEQILARGDYLATSFNGWPLSDSPLFSNKIISTLKKTLLTDKKALLVANVAEEDLNYIPSLDGDNYIDNVYKFANSHKLELVTICGKLEAELCELNLEERKAFLADSGMEMSGLERLTLAGYRALGLSTYFTTGPKESRAWTIPKGCKAPEAAGVIHSDFERGFIRAEVISYNDFITYGSELKCKEAGKLKVQGKDYIVEDGDIMHFRFNV